MTLDDMTPDEKEQLDHLTGNHKASVSDLIDEFLTVNDTDDYPYLPKTAKKGKRK